MKTQFKNNLNQISCLFPVKLKRGIFIFCLVLPVLYSQQSFAQTPGVWNGSTTNTVTSNDVAIGTIIPDGKTEIFIGCLPQNGLVITKDEYCPTPYLNTPLNLNAESVSLDPNPGEWAIPYSFNVGSTLPLTFLGGHYSSPISNNPLFWARTKSDNSGLMYSSTRFIVMPNGNTGINVYNPRATLDVRNMSPSRDIPVAIFGVNEISTVSGPIGNKVYKTRHLQIVPKLNENGYNQITQLDDLGMFFTDGKGVDGANQGSGLVIAPWSSGANPLIGGIRIGSDGNVQIHGNTRATKVTVNAKWWSDFVFQPDYEPMNLTELEVFIKSNKHLPNIPTEKDVIENGIDIAEMQALQLQKLEELTLYIIELNKIKDEQSAQIQLLKAEIEKIKKDISNK